ncbi:clathrin interactor EPSIN 2-like [Wolffia australiana]
MKKVFDQTVRDLKREVNKKVLKVPAIEQKVLDATSNEPWGPHGSLLADIAHATRNYAEFQITMSIIWKRINDTGKNWRHVYKGLILLEYLVAHGSEKVIDEIREHSYQISTLSDFQYISSSGRDEGSNVRKKCQSLVALVNDKDRIQEVRQKAHANKDKYRGSFSTGGGHYGDQYDEDHYHSSYGSREDHRNGYKDDDRYRKRDTNGRDGDRYGRDAENYRGNSGYDDYQFGSEAKNFGKEKGRSFDEDDRHSARSGGGKTDDTSLEDRKLKLKFSGPNHDAPPSYEEAVGESSNIEQNDRYEESDRTSGAKSSGVPAAPQTAPSETGSVPQKVEVEKFDEFDPRGSNSGPGNNKETDFFGLTGVESINSLALVPVSASTSSKVEDLHSNSHSSENLSAQFYGFNKPGENPFGEPPFKALPTSQDTTNIPFPQQASSPPIAFTSFPASPVSNTTEFSFLQQSQASGGNNPLSAPAPLSSFVDQHPTSFVTDALPSGLATLQPNTVTLETNSNAFLAPQTFPATPAGGVQTNTQSYTPDFVVPTQGLPSGIPPAPSSYPFPAHGGFTTAAPVPSQSFPHGYFPQTQTVQSVPAPTTQAAQGPTAAVYPSLAADLSIIGASSAGGQAKSVPPPAKEKFETKSTVWADTLSRGLVDLNISGPKTNPLADIGVDFDSINRKERRREKEKAAPAPISAVTMGKAMGAGSGMGRSAAVGLAPQNPMVGPGMGMGVGMGMGMGGYGGGFNQPMGMGMGLGMNMNMNMNMSMGSGAMGPGGMAPTQIVRGNGYNPMPGSGGFGSQQQYSNYR